MAELDLQKNEYHEVTITGVTEEGNGVGKIEGFAVFVPDTAVGDVCKIKLVKKNKSYGYGRLEELLTPSSNRIEVNCKSFHQCGGCSYCHIEYGAELAIKQDLVLNAFRRIGGVDAPIIDIIGSENITNYRNKAQYPFGESKDGEVISGFYAKRSHRVIASTYCELQPAIFAEIQQDVLKFVKENSLSIYNEETKKGLLRHLYLRHGEQTGELMVCLVVISFDVPKLDPLIDILVKKYPMIKSIVLNKNSADTNVILGQECKAVYGKDVIEDILCGVKIRLSPLSFYQVNRCQAEKLYNEALEYAELKSDDILLDLYCGAGTIGLAAAGKVKTVIGVEIIPEAVNNARENAKLNEIKNAEFICADAGKAAADFAKKGITPAVIIVDPPRKGLDIKVIEAIIAMAPKKVVMISCNPTTAARDCKLLQESGYEVKKIRPVDMFPRTTHVECVIALHRVEK